MIIVDTLRADHLHSYGYQRKTSPTLDRLAAEGVLFENVYASSTRTTPSIASLFTGRYPQTIGVRSLGGKLKNAEVTLAEVLKQHGYRTGGVCANPVLAGTQIDQGFDFFFIPSQYGMSTNAARVNDQFFSLFRQGSQDRPFFALVHYWDPHIAYNPPRKYKDLFYPDYRGKFKERFDFFRGPDKKRRKKHRLYMPKVVFNHTELSQKDLKKARALYDGEIAYTDMVIGKLLYELESRGVMENTLLVITSDHGESLGDHRYFFEHGDFVYEASARVPLIFRWPGKITPARKITGNVRAIDLLPTILSLLGVADTSDGREGEDIAGVLLGKAEMPDLPVFIESGECNYPKYNPRRFIHGAKGKIRGMRYGDWKLILNPTEKGPVYELYNLGNDPSETEDLASRKPKKVRKMAKRLATWMKKGEKQVIPPMNKKTLKRLRSVGYIQ